MQRDFIVLGHHAVLGFSKSELLCLTRAAQTVMGDSSKFSQVYTHPKQKQAAMDAFNRCFDAVKQLHD